MKRCIDHSVISTTVQLIYRIKKDQNDIFENQKKVKSMKQNKKSRIDRIHQLCCAQTATVKIIKTHRKFSLWT